MADNLESQIQLSDEDHQTFTSLTQEIVDLLNRREAKVDIVLNALIRITCLTAIVHQRTDADEFVAAVRKIFDTVDTWAQTTTQVDRTVIAISIPKETK